VVNATGPWLDLLRNLEDSACEPVTCLSKGIHVVLRPDEQWRAAVAVSLEGGQHLYAVPCEDMILLGTTEQEYHGDPAAVAAEPEDVSYLLQVARRFLRPQIQQSERQRARKDNARSAGPLGAGLPCGSRRVGLDRRTTLGLRGFDTPEIRQRISTGLEAGAQIPPPGLFESPLKRVV
jgi:glycerol-3-phosphate dehydrogenase